MGTVAAVQAPAAGRRTQTGDAIARWVAFAFAASILIVAVLLVPQLWASSAASRHKFGWGFLTSSQWNPVTEEFGALPFIYGTVLTSFLALLISTPLGLGAAIFLAELAPAKLSSILTFLIELLAAIPSVIYGLLAMFTLVPLMRNTIEPFLKDYFGSRPLFKGVALGVSYLPAASIAASPAMIQLRIELDFWNVFVVTC